ncbi:hypothetical protein, partial [Dethiosulfatibacter aminovorans]|uniref:hypothetical protein n=1 Tax=Dethiosulfatibacter aminovorans TaxID=332095 RepID=UPI001C318AA8
MNPTYPGGSLPFFREYFDPFASVLSEHLFEEYSKALSLGKLLDIHAKYEIFSGSYVSMNNSG